MPYAELLSRSCYALLEGASQPHELLEAAGSAGVSHLGLVDRDGVYGLVQAHKAAREVGVRLVCGTTLTVSGRPGVVLLAEDHTGWSHLCRLLTRARGQEEKGRARAGLREVLEHAGGLTCVLRHGWTAPWAAPLREAFGDRLCVALSRNLSPADRLRTAAALDLGRSLDAPVVATNDVLFHEPSRQPLADVLTCIRRRCTLEAAGRALHANGERHVLPEAAFRARFADLPHTVDAAMQVAERCTFSLDELTYTYPREVVPEGHTPQSWLRALTERGLRERYPEGVPAHVRAQVEHELGVVGELDFASYFLTVYDIVRFAREQGILCQGRGSAANSAVCYALGITAVDPSRAQLLFERFISKERGEPPDIDVDFEHERREEVIQYIYARYGRERASMVNEFICYRQRSAIRDVGKVFGLSLDQVDRLAKSMDRWSAGLPTDGPPTTAAPGRPGEKWSQSHEGGTVARTALETGPILLSDDIAQLVREGGLDPEADDVRATLHYAGQMAGLPRHLSIHVGGFVIADGKLVDLVPIEPASMEARHVVQWDKYDIDVLQFVKVDVLALGILTAVRKGFELVRDFWGRELTLASVPAEDPAVYDMFCQADTIGVFQIESRAQMSMLPRLKPRCFYDLVIEVSLVRPGPIQGGMVHPYLRRRLGDEPITYAHPALEPILERTLGVPLFQEQVMAMAVAVGGFTPGQADRLRRAMGAWRKRGNLLEMGQQMVRGMVERGIDRSYAEAVFQQILGFGEYGFPESHAASFALIVYVSGWLKCHYPAAFAAALINSQPMGFYSPRAILADAQRHGVEVRPACVLASHHDCTLEPTGRAGEAAIRLGLRLVKGIGEEHAAAIVRAREERSFRGLPDFARRTGLDRGRLQVLADAGAFEALCGDRRRTAWALQGLWTDLPLFASLGRHEPAPELPAQGPLERLKADYRTVGLSVDLHPMQVIRRPLDRLGALRVADLWRRRSGDRVRVAGLIGTRQRPGTSNGVVFLTFEDETGMVNLVVWPKTWQRFRKLARSATLLGCDGRVQRQDDALSVLVERFWEVPAPDDRVDAQLADLPVRSRDFR